MIKTKDLVNEIKKLSVGIYSIGRSEEYWYILDFSEFDYANERLTTKEFNQKTIKAYDFKIVDINSFSLLKEFVSREDFTEERQNKINNFNMVKLLKTFNILWKYASFS